MVADWVRCERCADLIYGKRFARTLRVCPDCGWHSPLTARQRLDQLLDADSAAPVGEVQPLHDPLEFADTRPYAERLADARAKTGLKEAVICALGRIDDQPVVVAAMDFRFLGGSLGCGVGALICEAARTSLARRVPLLLITASGGARMQEGALALMQMAKTAQAMAELDEAGILTVSLITDPTYGGVAASYATLADVILAEPGARLGFAGPRVIEQTTRERLPEGFQTAEFLMEHGMVDDIIPRSALRPTLARLLALGGSGAPGPGGPAAGTPARGASGGAGGAATLATHPGAAAPDVSGGQRAAPPYGGPEAPAAPLSAAARHPDGGPADAPAGRPTPASAGGRHATAYGRPDAAPHDEPETAATTHPGTPVVGPHTTPIGQPPVATGTAPPDAATGRRHAAPGAGRPTAPTPAYGGPDTAPHGEPDAAATTHPGAAAHGPANAQTGAEHGAPRGERQATAYGQPHAVPDGSPQAPAAPLSAAARHPSGVEAERAAPGGEAETGPHGGQRAAECGQSHAVPGAGSHATPATHPNTTAHGPADAAVDGPRTTPNSRAGAANAQAEAERAAPGGGPGAAGAARAGAARRAVMREVGEVAERDAWEAVRGARHPDRPTVMDYIGHIVDDFHELHGDRLAEDCPAVVGGPGRIGGLPVMVIGQHKGGASLAERQAHRFGMPAPSGYRKSARLMRMAAKLGLPVVTLVDTPGANPGPDAERGGQALAIAQNLRLMARLPVPVVAAVVGEGGSGGALALALADRVLISAGGIYSVISPEGCAAILWKNPEAAQAAAAALRLDPRELLRLGVVDGVVPEPPDGAHRDPAKAAALLGDALVEALGELVPWETHRLLAARAERFRRFGLDTGVPAGSAGTQLHTKRGAS